MHWRERSDHPEKGDLNLPTQKVWWPYFTPG